MSDAELVSFLQWALPRLRLRWPGFRKVRGQVRSRLNRRLLALDLPDLDAYRRHLDAHPDEWAHLDAMCRITISRFHRDRGLFDHLRDAVLPELALRAAGLGEPEVRGWSAGCASGEEPYTLKILWDLALPSDAPRVPLRIVATDIDEQVLDRARSGRYRASSLKELPKNVRDEAFTTVDQEFKIREEFKAGIEFRQQDIRERMPDGPFHLILCRNLAFTYFDEEEQRAVMLRIADRLAEGGDLAIGSHESLPEGEAGLFERTDGPGLHRRRLATENQSLNQLTGRPDGDGGGPRGRHQ